jgi:cobalamin synthase
MKGRTPVAICACAVISGLLYLLLAGVVDSQRFGIAGLGVMTVAAFALYFVSRRENACTDQAEAKNLKGQSDKNQYVWAALLLLWLLVVPRLVGALFLVLYFVVRMRRKSTKT